MPSVFDTQPPRFSEQEAVDIVYSNFGIRSTVIELYSDRDQNFLVQANSKSKFILKISNPSEQRSVVSMQTSAVEYVIGQGTHINVPEQIGSIGQIVKGTSSYFFRLLKYLEGEFLKDKTIQVHDYQNIGQFLGNLSNALVGFEHPGAVREFAWDVRSAHLIKERLRFLESDEQKDIVNYFLNEFNSIIIPDLDEMRLAVIHNDGNDHNILVDDHGMTTAIIDFGDMVYTFQVLEPAICMAYSALGKDDPIPIMSNILKGYHTCFPLNDTELRSVFYLSCLRLCITVTMASWRKKIYPENKYLTISEELSWTFLKSIYHGDISKFSRRLIKDVE